MIKFTAALKPQGYLFGFGLTETNLNRMEFNSEPIFFDFGYIGHPELFGLILYVSEFNKPEDISNNIDVIRTISIPFLEERLDVTPENLRVFPIAQSVMQKFRSTPFWGFNTEVEIVTPSDVQIFFAGRTENEIETYFETCGFITEKTKKSYKGFGK